MNALAVLLSHVCHERDRVQLAVDKWIESRKQQVPFSIIMNKQAESELIQLLVEMNSRDGQSEFDRLRAIAITVATRLRIGTEEIRQLDTARLAFFAEVSDMLFADEPRPVFSEVESVWTLNKVVTHLRDCVGAFEPPAIDTSCWPIMSPSALERLTGYGPESVKAMLEDQRIHNELINTKQYRIHPDFIKNTMLLKNN